MTKFTINKAAKATGKSTSVISRYVNEGKISAEKQLNPRTGKFTYQIDPAELFRVFPQKSEKQESEQGINDLNVMRENAEFRVKIEMLEALNEELKADKEYLKTELTKATETTKQITSEANTRKRFLGIF